MEHKCQQEQFFIVGPLYCTLLQINPRRILLLDCFYANKKMRIINVYTPPDKEMRVKIFRKLHKLLIVGHHTVLCGGFNAYTDSPQSY